MDKEGGDKSYPFVSVDTAAIVFVDISHLADVLELLTWEQYDLGLQDDRVFRRIADALGAPCFALILAAGPPYEFDGDGTYTLKPGAVRPCRP
ncbi:MAG: hypothetical protein WD229_05290 [Pirellulales bacterium]